MKAFSSIPFLRIIIPFVAGIIFAIYFNVHAIPVYFLFLLIVPIIYMSMKRKENRVSKILLLVLVDAFLIVFGINLVSYNDARFQPRYFGNLTTSDSAVTFIVAVNDLPEQKQKFKKCELKVLEMLTDKSRLPFHGKLIGYFKNSRAITTIDYGSLLMIRCRILYVPPPTNPFEFNYRSYLSNRQIHYTAFIDSTAFTILPPQKVLNPVWEAGLVCKRFILSRLKASDLSEDAYGICAALVTGYDNEIEQPVMDAFAHSGTLHVLSVSGLHTGLIYLVLNFFFDRFDRKKRFKITRLVFITVCLWIFALITGFAAPVLRAVIMFNLLGIGRLYFRSNIGNHINILLVSAFMLLCFNPNFIMDVGFQLSYAAMIGLFCFQPALSGMYRPNNPLLDNVWQSATASIAATISTLPLTLLYFKQFPFWFILCNIVVVPATFLLLLLAVLVVFKVAGSVVLTNLVIHYLLMFIAFFNKPGLGFIDHVDFTAIDSFFLCLIIVLFSAALYYRSARYSVTSFLLLICWQLWPLFSSLRSKNLDLFTVYNIKKSSAISIKNGPDVTLCGAGKNNSDYYTAPHLTSFNYPLISRNYFNYFETLGQSVLILDRPGFWPVLDYNRVTVLIISNNFHLTESDVDRLRALQTIVTDGSDNNYTLNCTQKLSRKFGFALHNTKVDGAYLLPLR